MGDSKNIIVGKVNGVQLVTVENERGSHTVICKLQDVPGMVEEIAELKGALKSLIETSESNEQQLSASLLEAHTESAALKSAKGLLAKLNQEGGE
jgi:hypothetical protein